MVTRPETNYPGPQENGVLQKGPRPGNFEQATRPSSSCFLALTLFDAQGMRMASFDQISSKSFPVMVIQILSNK